MTGYYNSFVRGYGAIARPLTELLKKDNFIWSEAADLTFQELKRAMSTTSVLALLKFSIPFIIETDACYGKIRTILMQDRRRIAYSSQGINSKKLGLSIYEKELLALVTVVSKWRHYLEGHHFIIKTDHQLL